MDCSVPRFPVLHYLPAFSQTCVTELVISSNDLILCFPLLLLPSIFPNIRVLSNESALCIRWPKYWSFSLSITTSNKYSKLISFRIDWLDLLVLQWTLKSLLQHHGQKSSTLQCSAFFMVQFSQAYVTTGEKNTLSTKQCFCFLICCLVCHSFSFQGTIIFYFHGCSHQLY